MTQVGDAGLAETILERFAEKNQNEKFEALPSYSEASKAGLDDDQQKLVNTVIKDGFVSGTERAKLEEGGFSTEFINTLSGENGINAITARLEYLSDRVESPFWSKGDLKQRAREAKEIQDLQAKLPRFLSTDEKEALTESQESIQELVSDLTEILGDEEGDISDRIGAAEKLAELNSPEAASALLQAAQDPTLAVSRASLLSCLIKLPDEYRDKVTLAVVKDLRSGNGMTNDDLQYLGTLLDRHFRTERHDASVTMAINCLERYAFDNSKPFSQRFTALVQLGKAGVLSAGPQLRKIVLENTEGMGALAQEALEKGQSRING